MLGWTLTISTPVSRNTNTGEPGKFGHRLFFAAVHFGRTVGGVRSVRAASQMAENLKFRIRAALQRCRKFFELRCPFRGCAPKTEFFSNLLRNKEVLQDSQSNLRSAALHKGKGTLPTTGTKYRPDR